MRILLISTSSGSRGGGELFLLYLAQGLKSVGHEVALWTSSHKSMDELCHKFTAIGSVLRFDYVNTYSRKLRLITVQENKSQLELIKKQWLDWKPDILHLNKQNLEDGLDLLSLVSHSSVPSICVIHITQSPQWLGAKLGWLRNWIARSKLKHYKGVFVTVASSCTDSLISFLNEKKCLVKVINNGVSTPDPNLISRYRVRHREDLSLLEHQLLFVSIGRLVHQKRPFQFIQSAKVILESIPYARFVWVGDGSLRSQWEQEIADQGLQNQIQCLGWQNQVLPCLAAADVYLHTAQYEGMPFAVLEALSVGLPCLISQDLLAVIPEFKEPAVLPLEEVLEDPIKFFQRENLEQWHNSSVDLFMQEFSLPIMTQRYEDLYHHCLSSHLL